MLTNRIVRNVQQQSRNLQIFEKSEGQTVSGIRATIFGATGFMGKAIGTTIGSLGSDIVYPSKNQFTMGDNVKMLRLTAPLGMKYVANHTNFQDPRALFRTMANSNVVVNCIGPRKSCRSYAQFQDANLDVARSIAKQARLAGVKRLVHLSSVGADPRAASPDLQTKFFGEQAVLEEFPEATILRLCTVVGMNDYFQRVFRKQACWFNHFVPVYSDLQAKRQPLVDEDVALCVLNALKLPETAGRTYELGGPHVYSLFEINEVMMNILQKPLTFAKVSKGLALKASLVKSWDFLSYDEILKSEIDLTVSTAPGTRTIDELLVRPVSVIPLINELQHNYKEIIGVVKDDYHI